jgi:predicted ATP-grasp superfamily ATP-dependent carboligase
MHTVYFNKTFSHIRSVMALIRAGDTEKSIRLVCSSPNPHFAGFLEAHTACLEPKGVTGLRYLEFALNFCDKHGIALFYPGKEAALMAQHREQFFSIGTRIISVAAPIVLEGLHDKAAFYQRYASAIIPVPDFVAVNSYEEFLAGYQALRQKHSVLCIKPAVSVYGIGFRVIDERRPALAHMLQGIDYYVALSDLQRELQTAGTFKPLLLMEYLGGQEYSVDCLASNGALRCAIPRRKERDARHGQVIDVRDDILAACAELASRETLNAVFNVQFRTAETGALKLLEVNPRMSGGTAMSCLAGPNLPYLAIRDALGQLSDDDIPSLASGIRVGEVPTAVLLP